MTSLSLDWSSRKPTGPNKPDPPASVTDGNGRLADVDSGTQDRQGMVNGHDPPPGVPEGRRASRASDLRLRNLTGPFLAPPEVHL